MDPDYTIEDQDVQSPDLPDLPQQLPSPPVRSVEALSVTLNT